MEKLPSPVFEKFPLPAIVAPSARVKTCPVPASMVAEAPEENVRFPSVAFPEIVALAMTRLEVNVESVRRTPVFSVIGPLNPPVTPSPIDRVPLPFLENPDVPNKLPWIKRVSALGILKTDAPDKLTDCKVAFPPRVAELTEIFAFELDA